MSKRQLKDHVKELAHINPHINPNNLEVGVEYHVPPIISIKRMDVLITSNGDGDKIGFNIVGSNDKDEKVMDKNSILAKFIVSKKNF